MRITFLGGAETVTGSKFLVETKTTRVLVDCGLFQGFKWLRERNWETLPVDRDSLDAVLLTHAHLDHSGYIPRLYKQGYRGPVFTHAASRALCGILLPDSGHIQEEDAAYLARHHLSKHEKPEALYDQATAEASLTLFEGLQFGEHLQVGDLDITFQPAGHILGAASIIIRGEGKTVGFSGDVGQPDDILMRAPQPLPALDYLFLESTYGNRRHESTDPASELAQVVNDSVAKSGALLIPSFAVGRAQALQHMLATLMGDGRIPQLPIYLDSPMAINVSGIYCDFQDQHKLTDRQCQQMCEKVTYTRTVDESKALADIRYPHIIIAGSGMATGGRILHHMKRLLGDHRTTLMFAGYQAGGTRGAKMLAGADHVRIHGEWVKVKADVREIRGLSGHGDYADIEQWLKDSAVDKRTHIHLVHGDPEALDSQRDVLRQSITPHVEVAGYRSVLHL
ncbi:MBL fold metallo-hydrolase [Gilvimarinus sp. F26214L]|uniref:MBL fold metallo-hydrolase n=1 Tax=Gilvimarinus sp. DZF01 TaxID=3461371 RepID=UPI004045EFBC